MSNMFSFCANLGDLDLSNFDTHNVTDMSRMFAYCGVKQIDLSSFDTQNVTDMSGMFHCCERLVDLDLSSFDIKNACNIKSMLFECKDISSFNLSSFDELEKIEMTMPCVGKLCIVF